MKVLKIAEKMIEKFMWPGYLDPRASPCCLFVPPREGWTWWPRPK